MSIYPHNSKSIYYLEYDDSNTSNGRQIVKGAAAQLIILLLKKCPNGLGKIRYDINMIINLISLERILLETAVSELISRRLLHAIGGLNGWKVSICNNAYIKLDEQVMGWSPTSDARKIAETIIAYRSGYVPELFLKSGWSERRFNPAMNVMISRLPNDRAFLEAGCNYPARGIIVARNDWEIIRAIAEGESRDFRD